MEHLKRREFIGNGTIWRSIDAGVLIVVFALAGAAQEQGVASPATEYATPTGQITPRS